MYGLSQLDGEGVPVVHRLRMISGGSVPDVVAGDVLTDRLVDMALASFPFQLLPLAEDDLRFGVVDLTTPVYNHPSHDAFHLAAHEDVDLGKLFPSPGETADHPEMVPQPFPYNVVTNLLWSSGGGGTLQLVMLSYSALQYLFAAMRAEGRFEFDLVPEFAASTVALMRKLSRDRRATVPMIVSLAGLNLSPGVVVEMGVGRIIDASPMRGHVRSVDAQTTAALVLDVELRLLDVVPIEASDANPGEGAFSRRMQHRSAAIEATYRAQDREVTRARLALALASPEDQLLGTAARSRLVLNPLSGGSGSWSMDPYAMSGTFASTVDAELAVSIADWGRRVTAHPESMWMGARRLNSSLAERRDPLDSFIDAVICWETLLGAESEVSFRVCGGLALLLEPEDHAKRLALFGELKDLYGIRSGLVHGSREPRPGDAHKHSQRAIRIAIDAMKAVYDRPELLQAGSSGERSRRLLLGA
jgi:hypothetical protein